MLSNIPIYIVCLLFIAACVFALVRRQQYQGAYRRHLLTMFPAFLLVVVGAWLAYNHMPKYELAIMGYRVPMDAARQQLYVGSSSLDDIVFHHGKDEMIGEGILGLSFDDDQIKVTQTATSSRNIISVNGLPLRSLPVSKAEEHKITFKHFGYSGDGDKTLKLEIPGHTKVGPFSFARPEFTYREKSFSSGFSHQIGGPLKDLPVLNRILPSFATRSGRARHLAWRDRVADASIKPQGRNLLRQASLIHRNGNYFLAANDAAIRLNGKPFPNSVTLEGNPTISLESHQLGPNPFKVSFQVIPPRPGRNYAFLQLSAKDQRVHSLPDVGEADRICLSRNPSTYDGAFDIVDNQFPKTGMLIRRQGDRFVFRGELMETGKQYSAGRTVFTIRETQRANIAQLALYALLFLSCTLLVPPATIRSMPGFGIIIAVCTFLLAFRNVLAIRAWLGPPNNINVFIDSAIAPFLFMLPVVVLISRAPLHSYFSAIFVRLRNAMMPSRSVMAPSLPDEDGGRSIFALLLLGLGLYLGFGPTYLGEEYLFLIIAFGGLALVLGWVTQKERLLQETARFQSMRHRYLPLLPIIGLLLLAMLSAPFMGGREIIPFLPGRLRPDIFIQIVLILVVAYQAGIWEHERQHGRAGFGVVFLILIAFVALPLLQGGLADDLGFFVVVIFPILLILVISSWYLSPQIRFLYLLGILLAIAIPLLFRGQQPSLDSVGVQRIAFWLDPSRLRQEQFFLYQAQVPILWASAQGFFGGGFFTGAFYPALASTSVNDNVASVFIQGELGGMGTILVMSVYALLAIATLMTLRDWRNRLGGFQLWVIYGVMLTFLWTAAAMFLQNLGHIPLTGKNLPLLGLDSKNDILRYGLLTGMMLRYMRQAKD